jgi:glycosyltransferase involved in cell wall biosynthesis
VQSSRVFYFGMINTSSYAKAVGENLYVAAGTLKMISIVHALRSVRRPSIIVTLPVLGRGSGKYIMDRMVSNKDGVPIVFLPSFRNRYLRKAFGMLSFAMFALKKVGRGDKVIIYNHALEYVIALLLLRIRGIVVVHDVEDLPIIGDRSLNGVINSVGYYFADLLCKRKILVAERLLDRIDVADNIVISGVAKYNGDINTERWKPLISSKFAPLKVHYGGALLIETGIELFCEAVDELAASTRSGERPLEFYVTGTGDFEKLGALKKRVSDKRAGVQIFLAPSLEYEAYLKLLKSCHISLALKLPESHLADTTFPSKTVEIASYGTALITTAVSDVKRIFNPDTAFILEDPSSSSLSKVIEFCARNPSIVRKVALSGCADIREKYSPRFVGDSLSKYLGD